MIKTAESLEEVMSQKEWLLLHSNLNTYRGIGKYAQHLGFARIEDFIKFIENKKILDVGSGFNGLAIDCLIREVNTEVYSLNPGFGEPHYRQNMVDFAFKEGSAGTVYSQEYIMAAVNKSLTKSVLGFAHCLPFADNSFDLVLDNNAVFFYSFPNEKSLLDVSVREMTRVLKTGGRLIVGDFIRPGGWKEAALNITGSTMHIFGNYSDLKGKMFSGAEVTKL